MTQSAQRGGFARAGGRVHGQVGSRREGDVELMVPQADHGQTSQGIVNISMVRKLIPERLRLQKQSRQRGSTLGRQQASIPQDQQQAPVTLDHQQGPTPADQQQGPIPLDQQPGFRTQVDQEHGVLKLDLRHFQSMKKAIHALYQYIVVMKNTQRRLLADQEYYIRRIEHQARRSSGTQRDIERMRMNTLMAFGLEYGLYNIVGRHYDAEGYESDHQETLRCLEKQWRDTLALWMENNIRDLLVQKLRSYGTLE